MERGERFYFICNALKSQRCASTAMLMKELGVSRATLNRDLDYLKDRYRAPIIYDAERGGYVYDPNNKKTATFELPGLWFNEKELHALLSMHSLLQEMGSGLLSEQIGPLKDRLESLLGDSKEGFQQLSHRIKIFTGGRRVMASQSLGTVADATLKRRQLKIRYRARHSDETTDRVISPQRLIHHRENWYVDAYCHYRKGPRNFALDAIQSALLLNEPALEVSEKELNRSVGADYGTGLHEPILDHDLWTAVQNKLKDSAARKGIRNRVTEPCVLTGKLFDESGRRMISSHAMKRSRRYRYYVSPTDESGESDNNTWRISAPEIEKRVEGMARAILDDRAAILRAGLEAGVPERMLGQLISTAQETSDWMAHVDRIQLGPKIQMRVVIPFDPPVPIEKAFPVQMKRRGVEMRIVILGQQNSGLVDPALIKAIGRALRWWDDLRTGAMKSAQDIANREGVREQLVSRHLPLAMLAPDIIQDIAEGRQPVDLTAQTLMNRVEIPMGWAEQRKTLGFQ